MSERANQPRVTLIRSGVAAGVNSPFFTLPECGFEALPSHVAHCREVIEKVMAERERLYYRHSQQVVTTPAVSHSILCLCERRAHS